MAEKEESIYELNKNMCKFIQQNYFDPFKIDGVETSQNKYAEECDLSSSTISKIENPKGYNISISTLHKLTRFQKIDLDKFFTEFIIQFPQHRAEL
ncbi:helix-turn-helix domain-containing protein [Sphingobacterium sp. UBA6320]|uniref:helix-turn-helix domain-containing protein n=1 Tax=Sphingobacterium sp. UBA6320 TaxID=1947510 RepID=UPI0025EA97A2|nr:helix-turn-helix transcriptional regulator [Sphingobacterium sp. UBA6320]